MPGRNDREAFKAYLEPMERALRTLDLGASFTAKTHRPGLHTITLNGGLPLVVNFNGKLALQATQTVECVEDAENGPYRMTTLSYNYEVHETAQHSSRVVAWHWHPAGRSRVTTPHFHMPPGAQFASFHFPTGRIAFEQVLRFLYEEIKVAPALENWHEILTETYGKHRDHRSWS